MPDLKGSKTHENLKTAFANEAQTKLRYLYYAATAEIEGFEDLAKLFQQLAELSEQHVFGHLDLLRRVADPTTGLPAGDTEHNLAALVFGETHDSTELYPSMARTALHEGFPDIADWFYTLAKAKQAYLTQVGELRAPVDRPPPATR